MQGNSKGTLKQIYDDLASFGVTEEMLKPIKEHMQEENREARFNEKWMNRDYNDEKVEYTRLYQKNPIIYMSGNQMKVYITLAAYAKTSNKIAASAPVIKALTGLSDLTIRNALNTLEEYGFLIRTRSADQNEPTLYMLNPRISSCCKVSLQGIKESEFDGKADEEHIQNMNRLINSKDVFVSTPIKDKQGIVIGCKIERATEDIKKGDATNTAKRTRTKQKARSSETSISQIPDFTQDPEVPFNDNLPGQIDFSDLPEKEKSFETEGKTDTD